MAILIRRRTLWVTCALCVTFALAGANAALLGGGGLAPSLAGCVVVVDAGHGGIDGGAVHGDTLEKNLNLAVANELRGVLKESGALVYMTRESDVSLDAIGPPIRSRHRRDLRARTNIATWVEGEVFVSVHMNSSRASEARGPTVFYRADSPDSRVLSESVLAELEEVMGPSRDGSLARKYYVLENVACPAILVEVGFMSNPSDRSKIVEPAYQREIAEAMARGLGTFLTRGRALERTGVSGTSTGLPGVYMQ